MIRMLHIRNAMFAKFVTFKLGRIRLSPSQHLPAPAVNGYSGVKIALKYNKFCGHKNDCYEIMNTYIAQINVLYYCFFFVIA